MQGADEGGARPVHAFDPGLHGLTGLLPWAASGLGGGPLTAACRIWCCKLGRRDRWKGQD